MCNTLALNLFHDRFAREFWCPARGFSAASPSQQVVASGRSGGLFSFSFHPATLAIAVQEEQDTIEDVYEPYLLQQGFLKRTPRGRVATERAFEHLGLQVPERAASLF